MLSTNCHLPLPLITTLPNPYTKGSVTKMAGCQDETNSKSSRKRVRQKSKKKSKGASSASRDTRITIGSALTRWNDLKTRMGVESNVDLALRLLDNMENSSSHSASSGAGDEKMKISNSEVQALIEQEVQTAVQQSETRLQGLIQSLLRLDQYIDLNGSNQKLQATINMITRRADAVFAHPTSTEDKSTEPCPVKMAIVKSCPDDEPMETAPQIKSRAKQTCRKRTGAKVKRANHFEIKEKSRRALEKLHAEEEALTAAMEDFTEKEELPPPVLSPFQSFPCKKEPEDELENGNNYVEVIKTEEQKAVIKEEKLFPAGITNNSKPNTTQQKKDDLQYPPLPTPSFPSTLNMEAASYNIPQKVHVRLALIRNPPGLSVMWNVQQEDPSAPPMQGYKIYFTMEKGKGSGIFVMWNDLGEVEARNLPMCALISKYKPGHRLCVAVVGIDKFGRYGPYSEVVTAALPE